MLLIYITVIAMLAMAKPRRGRRRRMGRYIRGNLDVDFALGTLAAQTLVSQLNADTVDERTRVTSIVATWALQGYTVTDNVGPIVVGVAHSDYSSAEIEAWVELATGWSEGDKVSQEVSNRLIRRVGTFSPPLDIASTALNDGRPVKTKLNWILNAGQNLRFWAYNQGSVAVGTTDPDVHITGHANLFPQ